MVKGWLGRFGTGKTYGLVEAIVERFRKRKQGETPPTVYTNMYTLRVPGAVYLSDYDGMNRMADGICALDEAGVWFDAQGWQGVPRDVLARMAQYRHIGMDMYYTAQGFKQVNSRLRTFTHVAVRCSMLQLWRGLFIGALVDPMDDKDSLGMYWRWFRHEIADLYSTYELIGDPKTGKGRAYRTGKHGRGAGQRPAQHPGSAGEGSLEYLARMEAALFRNGRAESVKYTKQQELCKLYLSRLGLWRPSAENFLSLLRYALERQEWLRLFRLPPWSVPFWCCREYPWCIPPPAHYHQQADELQQASLNDINDEALENALWQFWYPKNPFTTKLVDTTVTELYHVHQVHGGQEALPHARTEPEQQRITPSAFFPSA